MYKIRDRKTGKFFVKVKTGSWTKKANGKCYKDSEWSDTGKVIISEAQLNTALKALTSIRTSDKLPSPIYPTYTLADLQVVDLAEELVVKKKESAKKLITELQTKINNWDQKSLFAIKGIRELAYSDLDSAMMYAKRVIEKGGLDGFVPPFGKTKDLLAAYGLRF